MTMEKLKQMATLQADWRADGPIIGLIVAQSVALGCGRMSFGLILNPADQDYFPRRVRAEPVNALTFGWHYHW